jgi:steroid delta-isomerase-like uncharacterized protein
MPHDTQKLTQLVLQMWNSGKSELAAEVFTNTVEYRQPGQKTLHGLHEVTDWISNVHTAFPDFRLEITRTIAEGDHLVHCWRTTATHRGQFLGAPPTGKRVDVQGVTVSRMTGGRIQEATILYDRLSFLEQVGAVPSSERAMAGAAD